MKHVCVYLSIITMMNSMWLPVSASQGVQPKKHTEKSVEELERDRRQRIELERARQQAREEVAEAAATTAAHGSLDEAEAGKNKDVTTSVPANTASMVRPPTSVKVPSLKTLATAGALYRLWTTSDGDFNTLLEQSNTLVQEMLVHAGTKDTATVTTGAAATTAVSFQPPVTQEPGRSLLARALQAEMERRSPDMFFTFKESLERTHIQGTMCTWNKQLTACAYVDSKGKLFVWSAATKQAREIVRSAFAAPITCISWDPQGTSIAYGSDSVDIRILRNPENNSTPTAEYIYIAKGSKLLNMSWGTANFLAVSTELATTIRNLSTGKTMSVDYRAGSKLLWNPQGTTLAYFVPMKKTIVLMNPERETIEYLQDITPRDFMWNSQGTCLVVGSDERISKIRFFNVDNKNNNMPPDSINLSRQFDRLFLNPSDTLLATTSRSGLLSIYNLKDGNVVYRMGLGLATGLSWNPQGTFFAAPLMHEEVAIVDFEKRFTEVDLGVVAQEVYWNSEGTRLAVVGQQYSYLFTIAELSLDQLFYIFGVYRLWISRLEFIPGTLKRIQPWHDYRLQLDKASGVRTFDKKSFQGLF